MINGYSFLSRFELPEDIKDLFSESSIVIDLERQSNFYKKMT
jgi:hypothetical protein